MRNGRVLERNGNHLVAGQFAAAADRVRDFAGLAEANAHAAVFVAHDHERAEIETASALDDFGGAVDEHDLLDQLLGRAAVKRLTSGPSAARPAPGRATPARTALLFAYRF